MQQIEELRQQFLGYLIDSAFIQVDNSVIRELNRYSQAKVNPSSTYSQRFCRARWSRGRSKIVTIPTELDVNSSNLAIINAALAAGLYPKLLAFDPSKAELRTITNNQVVWIHPSSVNVHRRLSDMGCNYFAYFTLMYVIQCISSPHTADMLNSGTRGNSMLGRLIQWMSWLCSYYVVTASSEYVRAIQPWRNT